MRTAAAAAGALFAWLLLAVFAIGHADPGRAAASTGPAGSHIIFAGDANYPPYHYLDELGRPTGFDVELFRAVAEAEGFTVDFQLGDWGEALRRLERGEVDVVPMFASAERGKRFLFSESFLDRYHLAFGRKDGHFVTSLEDLAGHTVAVQHSGMAWDALRSLSPGALLIPLDIEGEALAAVARGDAEYAVVPMTIGYMAIQRRSLVDVVAMSPPLLRAEYGFAVSPRRPELIERINLGLNKANSSGEQSRLYLKWLAELRPNREAFRSGLMIGIWIAVPLLVIAIAGMSWWWRARRRAIQQSRRAESEADLRLSAEARARDLAFSDPGTGLPNKSALQQALATENGRADRRHRGCALVRIDLLRIGLVRSVAGEALVEAMKRQIAERMAGGSGNVSVFSVGENKLAALVSDIEDESSAVLAMDEILQRAQGRLELQGFVLEQRCRAGLAVYPAHGASALSLMRNAEMACTAAHENRVPSYVYEPGLEPDPRNLSLLAELRDSIADGTLGYVVQPKISLATGKMVGAEMLVRWTHPSRGPLAPDTFVPLAEKTGMIHEMTLYLVTRALEHVRQWQEAGLDLSMAVNVSVNDLANEALVKAIVSGAHGLEGRLILEVTETDIMRDATHVLASIQALRNCGVRISLDDFGTGYASLTYLRRMAPDEIKIDRSFISDLMASPSDQAIVRTSISLAHNLGATVTAEGIEDLSLLSWLTEAGCDFAQGFAIARPMAIEDLMTSRLFPPMPLDPAVAARSPGAFR